MDLKLQTNKQANGYSLSFILESDRPVMNLPNPVCLETWNPASGEKAEHAVTYDICEQTQQGFSGEAVIEIEGQGRYRIRDRWHRVQENMWQLDRSAVVEEALGAGGFRLRLDLVTAFTGGVQFPDLKYLMPSALYDKNDLDEDGVEDYFGCQNLLLREDRLSSPSVMAYHPQQRLAMTLIRADLAEFDSKPDRPNRERVFLQKTDVGSLGVWGMPGDIPQVSLRAAYPFYEGERTNALLIKGRVDWEAYWPAETGESVSVSYRVYVQSSPTFPAAVWDTFTTQLHELRPTPVPLSATAEELVHYRLEALNRYYMEKDASEDPNEPAGYVLNCHPQDGIQLSDIIQFGFTGQNIMNAYNTLRYGYQMGNGEYVRRALKVVDFFAGKAHIRETGMFYNLYNMQNGTFSFWWTGLILPLAYAEGEELQRLMGPVYQHMEDVIVQLKEKQGSYLRCMNEDAEALLNIYEYERDLGHEHPEWLETAKRYGEFLLRTQEANGTWYRAYEVTGKPMTVPERWFGANEYEWKSSTATSIPLLVNLYKLTKDEKFLNAAVRAGRFVKKAFVDDVKFNGGIHDSIYAKGPLIDYESLLFSATSLLALYKVTQDEEFRRGAIDGIRMSATWTRIWDVPLASDSRLGQFGFRSTGMGGADTASSGFVHPFEISGVPDLLEIAFLERDEELLRIAELTWHGCNQTVAVPGKDWGYRYPGMQEEGYYMGWKGADDPLYRDNGFGRRNKGEGNRTCFPWVPAVSVFSYWRLMDMFHTTDFAAIKHRFTLDPASAGYETELTHK